MYKEIMEKEFYTIKEFAIKLDVSTHTIRRSIKKGRIIAFRVGLGDRSHYRIPHTEVGRLMMFDLRNILSHLDS